ncbi:alpha-tocopherol transfer protein-like [Melanaphis sacchari]|uniref:Alpha-tocopherol transfer protein n=1 Tax=Melanaphis sacchari TaxID=742174 RepID=A0A2H8TT28_9HEMI|nr:alpha-tocopherol transfer protein-like [Melanaphis sacchari]
MAYSLLTPFNEYLQIEQSKYPEITIDNIQKLKESLEDDQTLPPISDKKYLAFLHSCNFDIELAKNTIKKYFQFHFRIPQVFCELDPLADDIELSYNCLSICQMPTVNTKKNDRVLFMMFQDTNPEMFEYLSLFKYLAMWMNYMLLKYGTCDGMIIVIDSKGLNWRHIVKLPIVITGKMLKFLEVALPIRLKAIHVMNAGSATQMAMKMVTRFANQDLIEKIKLHPVGSDDIFNYVSRNELPEEVGGFGKSHIFYNDELYNDLIDFRDVFVEQNEVLNNQMMYANQQLDQNDK